MPAVNRGEYGSPQPVSIMCPCGQDLGQGAYIDWNDDINATYFAEHALDNRPPFISPHLPCYNRHNPRAPFFMNVHGIHRGNYLQDTSPCEQPHAAICPECGTRIIL